MPLIWIWSPELIECDTLWKCSYSPFSCGGGQLVPSDLMFLSSVFPSVTVTGAMTLRFLTSQVNSTVRRSITSALPS